jgi:branched-subunit amino acid transport protein AzlD
MSQTRTAMFMKRIIPLLVISLRLQSEEYTHIHTKRLSSKLLLLLTICCCLCDKSSNSGIFPRHTVVYLNFMLILSHKRYVILSLKQINSNNTVLMTKETLKIIIRDRSIFKKQQKTNGMCYAIQNVFPCTEPKHNAQSFCMPEMRFLRNILLKLYFYFHC